MIQFPSQASDYAIVYRWWSSDEDKRVVKNTKTPILMSMATMRSKNPDVATYVIDSSHEECDWEDYPQRLGFSVIRHKSALESSIPKKDLWNLHGDGLYTGRGPLETASSKVEDCFDCMDVRRASWPLDVWDVASLVPERYIISVDSDVFWINSMFPMVGDAERFNVRSNNSGVFYFDKESTAVLRWMEIWRAYICLAVKDFSFRRRLIEKYPYPVVIGEDKPYFYIRDSYPDLYESMVRSIEPSEVLLPTDFVGDGYNEEFMGNLRWLHLTSRVLGVHKGRFSLFFRELFDDLRKFFTPEELIEVYGMTVFNNSVYSYQNLNEPAGSSFYDHLRDRMHAEVPPL